MSQDGFIAGENDNIDFLNPYQIEGEDYGYGNFIKNIGSIIVGRKTYDKVIGMGYPYHNDKEVYVITRTAKNNETSPYFYDGELTTLIEKLKCNNSGNIYCDGGAELAQTLIDLKLIDEMILSVIPVNLNDGILLFSGGIVPVQFQLENKIDFHNGLTQFKYHLRLN